MSLSYQGLRVDFITIKGVDLVYVRPAQAKKVGDPYMSFILHSNVS